MKSGAQTTVYVGPHFEVRGGIQHRYVFANGTRIALLTPTNTYYFHGDHLGSTRAITNGAGTTVWTGSYEPFGRLSSETGTRVSAYLFTGQELDGETGLHFFGARYYDPSTGMFTSADSVLARPYDPQSLNRYAYVGGKPLSRFDPDGHNWWSNFTNWVEKGFRWLGQHSNGGFVPGGSINSDGNVGLSWESPDVYTGYVGIGAKDPGQTPQPLGPALAPGGAVAQPMAQPPPYVADISSDAFGAAIGHSYGSGQCAAVRDFTGAPTVDQWTKGEQAKGLLNLPTGTLLANFQGPGGTYPLGGPPWSHTVIYVTQDGIGLTVFDQWVYGGVHNLQLRQLLFGGSGVANNGDLFHVVR